MPTVCTRQRAVSKLQSRPAFDSSPLPQYGGRSQKQVLINIQVAARAMAMVNTALERQRPATKERMRQPWPVCCWSLQRPSDSTRQLRCQLQEDRHDLGGGATASRPCCRRPVARILAARCSTRRTLSKVSYKMTPFGICLALFNHLLRVAAGFSLNYG